MRHNDAKLNNFIMCTCVNANFIFDNKIKLYETIQFRFIATAAWRVEVEKFCV